jgi:dienelactone hydrolase
MKIWKKILIGLAAMLIFFVGGFIIWGESASKPMEEALSALKSDASVQVDEGNWLVFSSKSHTPETGFIFYPGGKVDYRAYAPMAHALAAEGYLVIIPKMPLNLAVFGINRAGEVINKYPDITQWYIGGHSLGGSMAANYLYENQSQFAGLILLASYPASSNDLHNYSGKVLSIYGSNDGLATPAKIEASKALLPASTVYYEVNGGIHAYFGWYGPQKGDGEASITREEQQSQILEQLLQFMN